MFRPILSSSLRTISRAQAPLRFIPSAKWTAPTTTSVFRSYSAAAGLGKEQIQERILDVLKSFEKVDGAKVSN